tara:strand:- start:227278 stop:229701 length:2424 start_codon:yes stop_codon:yes gene_type:complete
MTPFRIRSVLFVVWTILSGSAVADGIHADVASFLNTHCYDCHEGEAADAGLDLSLLGTDLSDRAIFARWERIHDRVSNGEMPPPDYDPPSAKEQGKFVSKLAESLSTSHEAIKGTVLRRLNRQEYENTLNDMFGTNLRLGDLLPEDGRSHEFDNVGESLSVSMVQMQAYLNAAKTVLDTAIATTLKPPESNVVEASYAKTREANKFLGKHWLLLDDGAVVFYRRLSYPTGMLREAAAKQSGFYHIRVTGYAHQSERPITFSIGSKTYARGATNPTYGYFSFSPGEPTTVETTAWMDSRYMVEVTPFGISDPDNLIKKNGIENYKGPGLAIKAIEIEGPIVDEFPTRGHRLIFDGLNRTELPPRNPRDRLKPWYVPKFTIVAESIDEQVSQSLLRFATHAFRRPVEPNELKPFVALFHSEREQGSSVEEALRTSVTAILCSTEFLFLREPAGWLGDDALATRLSYFLRRSLPDESLRSAAAVGELSKNPNTIRAQVNRLLDDPDSDRFVIDFADAWLDLRDMDFTVPDQKLFPEFDPYLRFSMVEETRSFFRKLIDENQPVSHLVKSDFAMLNERMAEHYGIDGVHGPEFREVTLGESSVRGGLLSQASILKVSANGTNTSPVVRGVWVNERILGHSPAPPPPGIPGVEPDIRGASTLRELLDKHRDSDTCRSCHQVIDPPGFALECFNPIGGYRERFRTMGGGDKVSKVVDGRKVRYSLGLPVDVSGQMADGRTFADYPQFRDQLVKDDDRLARTLATKLLVFATGREMGFSDRDEINRIVESSAARRHGVRDLIHEVVQSKIFRRK